MTGDDLLPGYIECALWSSHDDGDFLDATYAAHDIAPEALAAMLADCAAFLADNADTLAATGDGYGSAEQIGHDLWLTRNGHGAGFWDRGLGEAGERLSDAARAMGESDLYVGDDGRLYVS